jgi:hypothetical protein
MSKDLSLVIANDVKQSRILIINGLLRAIALAMTGIPASDTPSALYKNTVRCFYCGISPILPINKMAPVLFSLIANKKG